MDDQKLEKIKLNILDKKQKIENRKQKIEKFRIQNGYDKKET